MVSKKPASPISFVVGHKKKKKKKIIPLTWPLYIPFPCPPAKFT